MSIEDLEQFTKETINIPNVNFSGLEVPVVEDILEALTTIMQKYPALKNTICSFGPNEDINNQYNLIANSNKKREVKWQDFVVNHGETLTSVCIGKRIPIIKKGYAVRLQSFIAIAYNDILMGKDIAELNLKAKVNADFGFHPKHCTKFQCNIYHEVGHILDFILNLKHDEKLFRIIEEHGSDYFNIVKNISEYAVEGGIGDIIAEAFAEYIVCPDSNNLINSIGSYIDYKYKLFEDSKVFKINNKFNKYSKVDNELFGNKKR